MKIIWTKIKEGIDEVCKPFEEFSGS